MSFLRISIEESAEIIEQGAIIIDVRDQMSYESGHIEKALHIDNSNISNFIQSTNTDTPLIIYCYHGNMSQSAANHFVQNGFTKVYSVDGGYEQWRHLL